MTDLDPLRSITTRCPRCHRGVEYIVNALPPKGVPCPHGCGGRIGRAPELVARDSECKEDYND